MNEPKQSTWAKTRKRHLAIIQEVQEIPKRLHLTTNSKTGLSVDFPAHITCTPTAVCAGATLRSASCYGLSGYMNYRGAIRLQTLNQRLVDSLINAESRKVFEVAAALYAELPRGRNWLRWNGVGDLTPGACRLINALTDNFPDLILWVVSRKADQVATLQDRPSLRLLLSLDHSTPPSAAKALREVAKRFVHATARLAYTRVALDDVPPEDVDIVFNKHNGGRKYNWWHANVCHATLPGKEAKNACDSCRRCFTK